MKTSSLVVAGLDIGAKNVHTVLIQEGRPIAWTVTASGFDHQLAAEQGLEQAAQAAGVRREDFAVIAATGAGRKTLDSVSLRPTEVAADARGAAYLHPGARLVIDVGADEARAIRLDESGRVVDFAINEKCAAGAGAFVEAMSRALEMSLDEFAQISLRSTNKISMSAQCTVFAESEVVSLIHGNTPPADIARAVHEAMASRVSALARRVGVEEPVMMGGGVALNLGFVRALSEAMGGVDLFVPLHAEYVGALGAALMAWDVALAAEET